MSTGKTIVKAVTGVILAWDAVAYYQGVTVNQIVPSIAGISALYYLYVISGKGFGTSFAIACGTSVATHFVVSKFGSKSK